MILVGNLTTQERAKDFLEISKSEPALDDVLDLLINAASQIISNYCKRKFKYGSVTEYYDGADDQMLLLNNWPIISVTTLNEDVARDFPTSNNLTLDDDYFIDNDSGIIERMGTAYWLSGRRSIKAVYTYGPKPFVCEEGTREFRFSENSTNKTATVAAGLYDPSAFATALASAFTAQQGTGITYAVTYSATTEAFTVTATGATTFQLLILSATPTATLNSTKYLASLMGFLTTADKTGALSYKSDTPSPAVDPKIETLCLNLVQYWVRQVEYNEWNVRGINRQDTQQLFDVTKLPTLIKMQLDMYRRIFVSRW